MTHVPEQAPNPSEILRFRVDPADVPLAKAARRLHLTAERFNEVLPALLECGFPPADETTGMYDLDAIDLWRANRHRSSGLTKVAGSSQAPAAPAGGAAERFIAAKNRQATGRRRAIA